MKNRVKVSIFCLTYNHAPYIRDALEGFFSQEVEFPVEVFVFDDASTDGTQEIIKEYYELHKDCMGIYLSEVNNYTNPDKYKLFLEELYKRELNGEYIAWCEGDDYWINRFKLKKQVEYLDSHPECSLCAHASRWIDYENNTEYGYHPFDKDKDLTSEEVILQPTGNISTASMVLRREAWILSNGFPTADIGDLVRQLHALTKGRLHYIDEEMSVYRYHHPGSWGAEQVASFSSRVAHTVSICGFYEKYDDYTCGKYHDLVKQRWFGYWYGTAFDNRDVSMDEYNEACQSVIENTASESAIKNINIMMNLHNLAVHNVGKLNQPDVNIIKEKEHVLIFGTGDYSKYSEMLLENSNLEWEGYLISVDKGSVNNKSKPIYALSDCRFNPAATAVVIGVHQNKENEVMKALDKAGFNCVIKPLWFVWA